MSANQRVTTLDMVTVAGSQQTKWLNCASFNSVKSHPINNLRVFIFVRQYILLFTSFFLFICLAGLRNGVFIVVHWSICYQLYTSYVWKVTEEQRFFFVLSFFNMLTNNSTKMQLVVRCNPFIITIVTYYIQTMFGVFLLLFFILFRYVFATEWKNSC